ncbi:MAG TPA: hypothetical protein VLB68_28195 [Pyrinomonadaceae bacterium]|nr:hypothetical protein [Pyrinomonadaceae bacterium]
MAQPLRLKLFHWLIAAAILHLCLTITVFMIGHFRLLPSIFDEHGIGLPFAMDSVAYRNWASEMVTVWQSQGLSAWFHTQASLHVRLYSISFAALGWLLGHNILAAEVLNLFYYLGILAAVYLLGKEVFNARAAFLAAVLVGVWPSFLLHTTQLVRDPISTLCLLMILYLMTLLLNREFGRGVAVLFVIALATLMTFFWLLRGNMWNIVVVATLLTGVFLTIKMFVIRRFLAHQVVMIVVICVIVVVIPSTVKSTSMPNVRPPVTPFAISREEYMARRSSLISRLILQLEVRRNGFKVYEGQASNIDSDVALRSVGDVARYLPRAAEIGIFAPFPNFWLNGPPFMISRVISGVETLLMYALYVFAVIAIWKERRRLSMWLILLVAVTGMISLGLAVINLGALFRLRYFFWILMIVIAARGFLGVRRPGGALEKRSS